MLVQKTFPKPFFLQISYTNNTQITHKYKVFMGRIHINIQMNGKMLNKPQFQNNTFIPSYQNITINSSSSF